MVDTPLTGSLASGRRAPRRQKAWSSAPAPPSPSGTSFHLRSRPPTARCPETKAKTPASPPTFPFSREERNGPSGQHPAFLPRCFRSRAWGAGLHLDWAPPLPGRGRSPGDRCSPSAPPPLAATGTHLRSTAAHRGGPCGLARRPGPASTAVPARPPSAPGRGRPPPMCQPPPWAQAPWGCPRRQRAGGWCLWSPAHAPRLGSALHSRPRCRQRAHSPDLKNRPRRAPRPGQEATPSLGERTLAGTGMRGGCLRGLRGLGTCGLPRLPRRGAPRDAQETPSEAAPGRVPGRGWGAEAGSSRLRTARTAQRRRHPQRHRRAWGQGAARTVAEKKHLLRAATVGVGGLAYAFYWPQLRHQPLPSPKPLAEAPP